MPDHAGIWPAVALGVAVVLLALWFLVVRLVARAMRPREIVPDPATMQLRGEPPAVVDLLVHGMRVTPAAAVATLLDLAARRYVQLFQPGPDPAQTLVRVLGVDPQGLTDYERKVLDRLTALTGGNGYARLSELDERHAAGGFSWARQFAASVVDDAIARRLMVGRSSGAILGMLFFALAVASLVTTVVFVPLLPWRAVAEQRPVSPLVAVGLLAVAVVTWFSLYIPMHLLAIMQLPRGAQTRWGRQVTAHWLGVAEWLRRDEAFARLPPASVTVWDRYLSYGVALHVAPGAVAGLDLDVGRTDVVWAQRDGQRRQVPVHYRRRTPGFGVPAWARLAWAVPVLVFWAGSAAALGGYLAGFGATGWALGALAAVQLGRAGYRTVRAVCDLATRVAVTGPVLAVSPANTPGSPAARYYLVVDGGAGRLDAWVTTEQFLDACRPGTVVRLTAEPWTRCVRAVTPVGGVGEEAATAPAAALA